MLKDVTRSKVLQVWSGVVVLAVVAGFAFGPEVTAGTWALLLLQSAVPPAIVLLLWPNVEPHAVAEAVHGSDRSAR